MKKNLFYLLALICSVSLFTACSDDDDPSWKSIPQEEISVEAGDAVLTVNGEAVGAGSVQMAVKSASEAVLTLKNAIPGYPEVPVEVLLQEQTDGSFAFSGKAELTAAPGMTLTKADFNPAIVLYIVSVEGSITKDGKANIKASTQVSEEAQGGLAGTWKLKSQLPLVNGALTASPLWIEWSAINPDETNMMQTAMMLRTFGAPILYNLLGSISFNADGNLTAEYNNGELSMETVMGYIGAVSYDETSWTLQKMNTSWATSPKGLVNWYTKNGLLYLVPNIPAIANQAKEDGGEADADGDSEMDLTALMAMLAQYKIDVTSLLPYISQWMTEGIPMKYTLSGNELKIYVDKEMAAPFINALIPALPALQAQLDAMAQDPEQAETYQTIQTMFYMFGIKSLTDIATVWQDNTDQFEISLNLVK